MESLQIPSIILTTPFLLYLSERWPYKSRSAVLESPCDEFDYGLPSQLPPIPLLKSLEGSSIANVDASLIADLHSFFFREEELLTTFGLDFSDITLVAASNLEYVDILLSSLNKPCGSLSESSTPSTCCHFIREKLKPVDTYHNYSIYNASVENTPIDSLYHASFEPEHAFHEPIALYNVSQPSWASKSDGVSADTDRNLFGGNIPVATLPSSFGTALVFIPIASVCQFPPADECTLGSTSTYELSSASETLHFSLTQKHSSLPSPPSSLSQQYLRTLPARAAEALASALAAVQHAGVCSAVAPSLRIGEWGAREWRLVLERWLCEGDCQCDCEGVGEGVESAKTRTCWSGAEWSSHVGTCASRARYAHWLCQTCRTAAAAEDDPPAACVSADCAFARALMQLVHGPAAAADTPGTCLGTEFTALAHAFLADHAAALEAHEAHGNGATALAGPSPLVDSPLAEHPPHELFPTPRTSAHRLSPRAWVWLLGSYAHALWRHMRGHAGLRVAVPLPPTQAALDAWAALSALCARADALAASPPVCAGVLPSARLGVALSISPAVFSDALQLPRSLTRTPPPVLPVPLLDSAGGDEDANEAAEAAAPWWAPLSRALPELRAARLPPLLHAWLGQRLLAVSMPLTLPLTLPGAPSASPRSHPQATRLVTPVAPAAATATATAASSPSVVAASALDVFLRVACVELGAAAILEPPSIDPASAAASPTAVHLCPAERARVVWAALHGARAAWMSAVRRLRACFARGLLHAHADSDGAFALRAYRDLPLPLLQPLSHRLDARAYSVFEADRIKYQRYRAALEQAVCVLAARPNAPRVLRVCVLGAGAGGLVHECVKVARALVSARAPVSLELTAVEVHPHAVRQLAHRNMLQWAGTVRVVLADMRHLVPCLCCDDSTRDHNTHARPQMAMGAAPPPWAVVHGTACARCSRAVLRQHVLVAELLGALGDNELAPECLAPSSSLLLPGGFSIPRASTNYFAPVHAPALLAALPTPPRAVPVAAHLHAHALLAAPRAAFTFQYPDPAGVAADMSRSWMGSFECQRSGVCHGLAGYFTAELWCDPHHHPPLTLSIVPESHTRNMNSWFPAFLPLRVPRLVCAGEVLRICVWRRCKGSRVWYEWRVGDEPVQNAEGQDHHIEL